MFEVYHFNEIDIIGFALTLIRISACIVVLPIFGSAQVPHHQKILISLAVSLALFPVVRPLIAHDLLLSNQLILLALREALVGAFIGYMARLLFIGISISGQLIGFSAGLGTASLINPATNESGIVLEQFQTVLGVLLFLGIDGHHMFFAALHKSFTLIQVGSLGINVESMANVALMAQKVFIIGLQLAAPMIAVIWFLNIAMGLVGRAVTQINVFVASAPVNFLVGIFVMMLSIPLMVELLDVHFYEFGETIFKYMRGF